MTSKSTRHFYAAQAPRGFANEIEVHRFPTKADRDAWVEAHEDDGDMNAATQGAYAVTAAEAREILGYRGDEATKSYNGLTIHRQGEGSETQEEFESRMASY